MWWTCETIYQGDPKVTNYLKDLLVWDPVWLQNQLSASWLKLPFRWTADREARFRSDDFRICSPKDRRVFAFGVSLLCNMQQHSHCLKETGCGDSEEIAEETRARAMAFNSLQLKDLPTSCLGHLPLQLAPPSPPTTFVSCLKSFTFFVTNCLVQNIQNRSKLSGH